MRSNRSDTEALLPYLQPMATQVTHNQVSLPGLTRREGILGKMHCIRLTLLCALCL